MMRPYDITQNFEQLYWETYNPIVPYNIIAVSTDTGVMKVGNGIDRWSDLPYSGSNTLGSKYIENGSPNDNETLAFSETDDEWQYRLIGCTDTETNWNSSTAIFGPYTMIIEVDDLTTIPTGRFKIGDGVTAFPTLPWFGADFNLSDFSVGESIEFNGTGWDPVIYVKPTELQSATVPSNKFHRDDGTWAYLTDLTNLESINASYGVFPTVYIGGFPTEATTVTLTSDGTSLFIDDQKVWTEYNDGTGSGLDADTLDGYHSTAFPTSPATGIAGNFVAFGASPNILVDSEHNTTTLATVAYTDVTFPTVPTTTTIGNIVTFGSTDGLTLTDSGSAPSDYSTMTYVDTTFPTTPETVVSGNFVTYYGSDGLVLADSGKGIDDFATDGHTHDLSEVYLSNEGTIDIDYCTLEDYFDIQGAGRITGGLITNNGDGTVAVSSGRGLIKTAEDYITGTIFFEWDAAPSIALTSDAINYIYLDYNSGTPTIYATTDRTILDLSLHIAFGRVFLSGATDISFIQSGNEAFCITSRVHERLIYTDGGLVRASGGVISGTGTRNIASTAGKFYLGLNAVTTVAKDTSGTDTFTSWYRNGSGGWTSAASQTQISNTLYDDGDGTLGTLSNNQYGVHWVFIRFDGKLDVVYGQSSYTLALANSATLPSTIPPILSSFAILAAKIIILKSDTVFTSIASAYTTAFPINTASNHNDLGGIQGGTTDQYYHLTSTEYTTTVPKYYGSLASEPATYKPGDYYFNTGDSKMKFYVATVGWKSFIPDA